MTGSLAEAVRARVLGQDGPDRYRFAHDLFREYAYERAARRGPGRGCTSGSGRRSRPSGPAAARSRWPSWPGTSCRPIPARPGPYRYCVAAAREATRRLAYEEAVRHWEGALARRGRPGHGR